MTITSESGRESPAEPPAEPHDRAGRQRRARVLVVDDNEVIRRLISVNLELEGFEVHLAEDGLECLELVAAVRPDAVTLDVVMPRLDGFSTLARLRGRADTRELPVVMVSACAQEADLARGRELGVETYLTKPFDPAELVRAVRSAVSRRASTSSARVSRSDRSYG